MDWKTRALTATPRGSKFGAVLRAALRVERKAVPRFQGRAYITSDGFVMCDFVGQDGQYHAGAFVGSWSDVEQNTARLAKHLSLNTADESALRKVIASWVAVDYRSR